MKRKIFLSFIASSIIGMSLCTSGAVWAFNAAGHIHSMRVILENSRSTLPLAQLRLSSEEKQLIEYCAQLPDMSRELDAVAVYKDAILDYKVWNFMAWGFSSNHIPNTVEYKRMVAVQQLQHALSEGNAEAMRTISLSVITSIFRKLQSNKRTDPNRMANLCAVGFAFHLYGDTFAHRQIPWSEGVGDKPVQTEELYWTGSGHAIHAHYPDDIHCNYLSRNLFGGVDCHEYDANTRATDSGNRTKDWCQYVRRPGDLTGNDTNACQPSNDGVVDKAIQAAVVNKLEHSGRAITGNPDDDDMQAGDSIEAALTQSDIDSFPLKIPVIGIFDNERSCESRLADDSNSLKVIKKWVAAAQGQWKGKGRCYQAWDQFSALVVAGIQDFSKTCSETNLPQAWIQQDHSKQSKANCEQQSPVNKNWLSLFVGPDGGEMGTYRQAVLDGLGNK